MTESTLPTEKDKEDNSVTMNLQVTSYSNVFHRKRLAVHKNLFTNQLKSL